MRPKDLLRDSMVTPSLEAAIINGKYVNSLPLYQAVPLGYLMWQKKKSKLELAASMVHQVMPEFCTKKNVVILCDSWYAKKDLICVVNEYPNLNIICNARYDSVIYDPAQKPTRRRERPAKYDRHFSIQE